jgi:hypothetical protein
MNVRLMIGERSEARCCSRATQHLHHKGHLIIQGYYKDPTNMPSKPAFLDLPTDIWLTIYRELFQRASVQLVFL